MTHLYRFYSNPEFVFDVLKNKRIALVRPKLFNDPFDPIFNFKAEFIESYDYFLAYVRKCHLDNYELIVENISRLTWKNHFNDWHDYGQKFLESVFVICFCYGVDDEIVSNNAYMWGHYANGYKGVCLKFDYFKLKKRFQDAQESNAIFRVEYVKNKPVLTSEEIYRHIIRLIHEQKDDFENTLFGKKLNQMIFQKNFYWEHENEYRLMVENKNTFDDIFYEDELDDAITGIYFGCRFNENEKNVECRDGIINAARENFPHAKLYDSKPVRGEFKLEFLEI